MMLSENCEKLIFQTLQADDLMVLLEKAPNKSIFTILKSFQRPTNYEIKYRVNTEASIAEKLIYADGDKYVISAVNIIKCYDNVENIKSLTEITFKKAYFDSNFLVLDCCDYVKIFSEKFEEILTLKLEGSLFSVVFNNNMVGLFIDNNDGTPQIQIFKFQSNKLNLIVNKKIENLVSEFSIYNVKLLQ
jgi:hypothetical protein